MAGILTARKVLLCTFEQVEGDRKKVRNKTSRRRQGGAN